MQFVTVFTVNYLIFFAVYYYWRVNKGDGLFTLVSYYICIAINPLGISLLCHFCSSDGIFEKLSGSAHAKYLSPAIVGVLGGHWGKLLFSVIYACYYIALVPFVLKKLEAWLAEPEKSTPMA